MRFSIISAALVTVLGVAPMLSLVPLTSAEVPQEHSHDSITNVLRQTLQKNTGGLPDPIFGLLGDAKANENAPDGDGKCLQQNIADQTITNAKAANDKK